ncbi:DUF4469 domain-containing protein [Ancylomarina salipaludis]|uniref:DUF4469 domain-containing protein n=1 Tax=Ancylomarina salipaludis TaxID=2501299 RepID=A0A4Q1JNL2_9BACT|nr:DUF4469 domain-containing protein [Ancylomarina salipaludis]RXQ95715.1 DUF4469 domain-containing protein [Ancylomarina salipaludis]
MEYCLNSDYLQEIADNYLDKLHHLKSDCKENNRITDDLKIKISSFKNYGTNSLFSALGSGSIVELRGKFLKFDSTDKYQGIFLLKEDGSEYRVSLYLTNRPNRLIFQIPLDLNPGWYKLELRTLHSGNKALLRAKLNEVLKIG